MIHVHHICDEITLGLVHPAEAAQKAALGLEDPVARLLFQPRKELLGVSREEPDI